MLFSDLASKTFTRFAITLLRCPSEVNMYSDSSYFLNRVGKTKKFICSHDLLRNHPRLQTIVIEVYTQINFRRKGLKMIVFWAALTYKAYIPSTSSHAWSEKRLE